MSTKSYKGTENSFSRLFPINRNLTTSTYNTNKNTQISTNTKSRQNSHATKNDLSKTNRRDGLISWLQAINDFRYQNVNSNTNHIKGTTKNPIITTNVQYEDNYL